MGRSSRLNLNKGHKILWATLTEKIPNLENFVMESIDKIVREKKKYMNVPSKEDIIDTIIKELKRDDD